MVLVNSIEFDQLRSAYRNYFSDTSEFLSFLTTGDSDAAGRNGGSLCRAMKKYRKVMLRDVAMMQSAAPSTRRTSRLKNMSARASVR